MNTIYYNQDNLNGLVNIGGKWLEFEIHYGSDNAIPEGFSPNSHGYVFELDGNSFDYWQGPGLCEDPKPKDILESLCMGLSMVNYETDAIEIMAAIQDETGSTISVEQAKRHAHHNSVLLVLASPEAWGVLEGKLQ